MGHPGAGAGTREVGPEALTHHSRRCGRRHRRTNGDRKARYGLPGTGPGGKEPLRMNGVRYQVPILRMNGVRYQVPIVPVFSMRR
jgi:hypothetical protein